MFVLFGLKKNNVDLKMIFVFFFFTYFTLLNCNCSEDAFSHDACFISNCRKEE